MSTPENCQSVPMVKYWNKKASLLFLHVMYVGLQFYLCISTDRIFFLPHTCDTQNYFVFSSGICKLATLNLVYCSDIYESCWCWWVEWDCLWTAATDRCIVHPPYDIWVCSLGRMILTRENWRTQRKTHPRATLSTTNPTWTDPSANPGLCGNRPATNHLSHGTDS
jgi:hypothetical protein